MSSRTVEPGPRTVLLLARTTQSELRIADGGPHHGARPRHRRRGPAAAACRSRRGSRTSSTWSCGPGEPVAVEKIVALVTSRDVAVSEPCRAPRWSTWPRRRPSTAAAGATSWLGTSCGGGSGSTYGDGDGPATAETLRTLRLSVFHLLQSVSPHNVDLDAGIPARGLHGEAYRGHVFWDELFVFPVLTLRLPGLARALLRYRTRRLDAARRAARAAGYAGAMYPWQSGSDGREETQRVHLNPLSGRWLPDTSHLQRHVGLAVAYNIWQYYQATGDLEFLADHGAETLLEIARFFAGLADLRRGPRPLPDPRRDGARRVQHPLPGRVRARDRRQRLHQRDDRLAVAACP